MFERAFFFSLIIFSANAGWACELCAIINEKSARHDFEQGFSFAVSEQFISYNTVQLNSRRLPPSILDQTFLESSMTHLVPTWNFSEIFGVSLSVPVVHKEFRRFQLTGTGIFVDSGEETGLGDLALIGRCRVFEIAREETGLAVSLLAGVKFPTGDAGRLKEEVDTARTLDAIYGVGHQHSISGIHLRDLALGSGSVDGVFGLTANSRWTRLFCNAQFQYYLRTSGESGYQIGDEWIASGGPGVFIFSRDTFTLNLQALATYDTMEPDRLLHRENRNTGMSAVYLGPQLNLTFGKHFGANAGVDLPLKIDNHGLQNVPDYRVHGGLSLRF